MSADKKYEALKAIFRGYVLSVLKDIEPLDPNNYETVKTVWGATGKAKATAEIISSGQIDDICELKARL